MTNIVPRDDRRSEKVKEICVKHIRTERCRTTCPLSEPCKLKPQDNIRKFLDRMNEAAEALKEPTKKCIILNGQFSWILRVDGVEIPFQGSYNAEYFSKLYKKLGYEVDIIEASD